jgi:hypothetical protein
VTLPATDQLRYERKFVADLPDPAAVCALLKRHPAMFRETFPPRVVDNLYLDTPGLAGYADNLEGNPDRAKVRIRWYGEFFRAVADGFLEVKVKRGLVGGKRRYPLPTFRVDEHLGSAAIVSLVRSVEGIPGHARALLDPLETAFGNWYRRRYYLSADGRFRATIDDGITFLSVGRHHGPRVRERLRGRVVLELKYAHDDDVEADRVCAWFPFRPARHSKYARGVEGVWP